MTQTDPSALADQIKLWIDDIAPAFADCRAHIVTARRGAMERLAERILAALRTAGGQDVVRVVKWLRDDADQTEWDAGIIVAKMSGPTKRVAEEWARLVAAKRGIADAIEAGEPWKDVT